MTMMVMTVMMMNIRSGCCGLSAALSYSLFLSLAPQWCAAAVLVLLLLCCSECVHGEGGCVLLVCAGCM